MKEQNVDFIAALDGVELSKEQIQNINAGIQEVVMRELAGIDRKGDFVIAERVTKNPRFLELPHHTMGIWVENLGIFRNRQLQEFKKLKG